mgnify:CR=1 FL=1
MLRAGGAGGALVYLDGRGTGPFSLPLVTPTRMGAPSFVLKRFGTVGSTDGADVMTAEVPGRGDEGSARPDESRLVEEDADRRCKDASEPADHLLLEIVDAVLPLESRLSWLECASFGLAGVKRAIRSCKFMVVAGWGVRVLCMVHKNRRLKGTKREAVDVVRGRQNEERRQAKQWL